MEEEQQQQSKVLSKEETPLLRPISSSPPAPAAAPVVQPPKRKLTQQFSGVPQPDNVEGHGDHFILSILDPYDNRVVVWLVRLVLFWGLFVMCGFFITFGAEPSATAWAVLVGAVLAYVLCIGVYICESYFLVPYLYRNEIGRPMVHWMCWAVFLDIIYHAVHPENHKDFRESLVAAEVPVLTEENEQEEFWLDFVADVGDGFNPTFSVFSTMARAKLDFAEGCTLPRANSLIVGGDICYPWPRYEDILSRFIRPLSWAFPCDMAEDDVLQRKIYVMPGNHEYADGLRNFRRLILQRENIGAWQVANSTPYFAVKLPHGWWLFCIDPGSESKQDMDATQIDYFTRIVREKTAPEDRFIMCVHEPDWIKNTLHEYSLFKEMILFRENVLGDRLRLSLAGDLHYYRRMEQVSGRPQQQQQEEASFPSYVSFNAQLVVAGHGGAFSHPTYVPESTRRTVRLGTPFLHNAQEYRTVCNYPTPEESKSTFEREWLTGFAFGKNYGFGSILGLMYVGMCLSVHPAVYSPDGLVFPTGLQVLENDTYVLAMLQSFWFYPAFLFLCIMLYVMGTTSQSMPTVSNKLACWALILMHIVLHSAGALLARKLIDSALAEVFRAGAVEHIRFDNTVLFCFVSNTCMFLVGFFIAPLLTAYQLYFSQHVTRVTYNEAMSTIEYQDAKGFVRMKITRQGIDLYSVGLRKVPRQWMERADSERTNEFPSHFQCADMREIEPFIVEHVHITRDDEGSSNSEVLNLN